jgi:hypothetical protein
MISQCDIAILLVDLGEFRARAFRVAPLRDVGTIEKRHVEDRIGEDVLESVVAEIDFVVADQRILLKAVVRRRAGIVNKSPQGELR